MQTKLLFASAVAIGLFGAAAAYAQSSDTPVAPPTAPSTPNASEDAGMPPSPPPVPGAMDDDEDAGPPHRGPGKERMAEGRGPRPGGPRGPHGMMMLPPPPPPPPLAAAFRVKNGPFELRVRCAEKESMQACADIALKMLDAAKTLPRPSDDD